MKKTNTQLRRPNEFTGRPRKWVAHDHRRLSEALEVIEAIYSEWRSNKRIEFTLEEYTEMLKRIEPVRNWCVDGIAKLTGVTLTAAELNYCTAEGIDPKEFLARKQSNT